jgi:hypothetical protein
MVVEEVEVEVVVAEDAGRARGGGVEGAGGATPRAPLALPPASEAGDSAGSTATYVLASDSAYSPSKAFLFLARRGAAMDAEAAARAPDSSRTDAVQSGSDAGSAATASFVAAASAATAAGSMAPIG